MRSRWVTALAATIAVVVVVSIAIGLSSPDGRVGQAADEPTERPASAATSTPTATPSTTDPLPPPPGTLAPAAVSGSWPGRPAGTVVGDSDVIDWCPAVRVSHAGEADRTFGKAAVRRAACTAVAFVFGQRYSRLALPRTAYDRADFTEVIESLTDSTAADVYRPRVDAFVAAPRDTGTSEALGLVLFTGNGTPSGADHATAGEGRVFYGPAYSEDGYRERAVWINPTFGTVRIGVDRTKATPRLTVGFTASASLPVYYPARKRDDMMTVPTRATYTLRPAGDKGAWTIDSWRITTGVASYGPLAVNR